jgi:hypothetical protein
MQSVSLQSGQHHTISFLLLSPTECLDFSEQILHTLVGCFHCLMCLLLLFQNSATKCRQMAAHSRAIFSATQACVQAVEVVTRTSLYKPVLCSGIGCAERWESLGLASRAYASKC